MEQIYRIGIDQGEEWGIAHVIWHFTEIFEPANTHKHWVCK